jgi:hypothetical protein
MSKPDITPPAESTALAIVPSPLEALSARVKPMAQAVAELFSETTPDDAVVQWAGMPMTVATARKVHVKEAQRAYRAWLQSNGLVK